MENDIDFSASLNAISDNDLFKFFLNEEFVDTTDQILSSPNSLDGIPTSSDSPQPSPPQLSSPERPEGFGAPLVSIPTTPAFNTQLKIKEEGTNEDSKLRSNKKRPAPASKETESSSSLLPTDLLKISKEGSNPIRQAPEAEKQIKRQKRLIKNRESAQLSRLRKKLYIEELERKVNHLTTDNETLTKQVNSLNGDKKRLSEEVVYLQNIIKQSPELSAALATRKSGFQPKNMKAAGVCLLIMLFSVGLLFNQSKSPLPFSRSAREEIPEVIPKSTLYTGRVLKSVPTESTKMDEEPIIATPRVVEIREDDDVTAIAPLKIKDTSKERKHKLNDEDEVTIISKTRSGSKQIEASKKKRMKISEESTVVDTEKGLVPAESNLSDKQNEIVPRINPNANYIYCPEAHYVAPATASSDGPEIVALLLPASVLNGTLYGDHPNLGNSLLEVSCQVLNLHMWPLNNSVPQR